jgi:hypothetical protein
MLFFYCCLLIFFYEYLQRSINNLTSKNLIEDVIEKIILIKGRNPKNKLFKEIFFCRFLEDFLQFDIYYMKVIVKIQRKIKKKKTTK